jgi:hypothetical protein
MPFIISDSSLDDEGSDATEVIRDNQFSWMQRVDRTHLGNISRSRTFEPITQQVDQLGHGADSILPVWKSTLGVGDQSPLVVHSLWAYVKG